jgi:cytochrome c2
MTLGLTGVSPVQASESDPMQIMRARGCVACHIIPGIPEAMSTLGPSLKGLSQRKRIVAGTLTNTEVNLRKWLANPKRVKPDTMMPNLGLSQEEVDVLVEYFGRI